MSAPDPTRGAGGAAAAASPAGPGAGKLRAGNSRAAKPLRRAPHRLRHLPRPLSAGSQRSGGGEGPRPANAAGPGAQRVTGGRASDPRRWPPSRAAPPAKSGRSHRRAPAGPVTTPAPGRRRALPRGPHPSDSARSLPETQPGSRGATRSQAAALRPLPPHLRSAAAPHLLAGSARPVGARTDPRAGTLLAAVTRDATATVAFSSSAQAPAASRGSRSEPR